MAQDTRIIELIDKMIERETRYLKEAIRRHDVEDEAGHYRAIKVLQEFRQTITGTWTHGSRPTGGGGRLR